MPLLSSLRPGALIVLALGLLLSGCSAGTERIPPDRSLLTGTPCAPPCWQGVIPGLTTADEALEILADAGYEPSRSPGSDAIDWSPMIRRNPRRSQPVSNWLVFRRIERVVEYMSIALEFDLTAQEVLDQYGPPESYQAFLSEEPWQGGGVTAHVLIVKVRLHYLNRGLILEARTDPPIPLPRTVTIDSDMVLDWVYYLPPSSTGSLAEASPLLNDMLGRDSRPIEPPRAWQGFPIEYEVPIR
jgi:hypothetical protein